MKSNSKSILMNTALHTIIGSLLKGSFYIFMIKS